MNAIAVYSGEEMPVLRWEAAPDPVPEADEVLVQVMASAVNRADLSQARGHYPPPPGASEILGLEMAGRVGWVGPDVTGWAVGDRVCALLPGGGYAERVAVPADMLIRLPDHWSYEEGAAIPEVWLTAFVNLFREGGLRSGERVLIHAGASGVGTAAIQLAVAVGAAALATAGTYEKCARCLDLGAVLAVNYRTDDFQSAVEAQGGGVDVILDPVGAAYLERNLRLLRPQGRLICIGLLSGSRTSVDLSHVLRKRLRIAGSTLRNRPRAEKAALTAAFWSEFGEGLARGDLRPVIDRAFPLVEAGEAHAYVAANRNVGKVILRAPALATGSV